MIAYMTFLLIILVLAFPVTFIITLIVKLFQLKRISREMYPGIDILTEDCQDCTTYSGKCQDKGENEIMLYSNDIRSLWFSDNEAHWREALAHYYELLRPEQISLEKEIESIKSDDIKNLSPIDFYHFLHDKYFLWKYTAKNRLATTRKSLRKYIDLNELHILADIQSRIFTTSHSDIEAALKTVSEIRGLGISGASGLLSILFPENFGTTDQFVVHALSQLVNLPERGLLLSMQPENLHCRDGVFLIKILREKAAELNKKFCTNFWTPRKIDMILWSIGR